MKARLISILIALSIMVATVVGADADTKTARISHGYSILYLPLIVMKDRKFFEAQALAKGLGDIDVQWSVIDGGNVINDAILSGAVDIAGIGTPGLLALWDKGKGNPRTEVIGLSGQASAAMWLNSNKSTVKTLRDFSATDKIALPGIKTSLPAVILQMAVAKEFGVENYAKLDPLTVGLSHPDALIALTTGRGEITAHFTSPPFSYLEVRSPNVHRVLNSVDVLGNITLSVVFALKKFTDDNPRLTEAFIAAMDETNDFIAKNKDAAAEIYIRNSHSTMKKEDLTEILSDRDTQFSTTPTGVMLFADFMGRARTIKRKPGAWTDAFIPLIRDRLGN